MLNTIYQTSYSNIVWQTIDLECARDLNLFKPKSIVSLVQQSLNRRLLQWGKASLAQTALSVPPGKLQKTPTTVPGVLPGNCFLQDLPPECALHQVFHADAADCRDSWGLYSVSFRASPAEWEESFMPEKEQPGTGLRGGVWNALV